MATHFPGNVLSFSYPTDNRFMVRTRYVRRRLFVERVRDLERDPIDPYTLWSDPWRRRCRFLLIGQDLDLQQQRSFYLDSARCVRQVDVPVFRLGSFDPLDSGPVLFRGPVFTDAAEDLARMQRLMRRAYHLVESDVEAHRVIGVFPIGPAVAKKFFESAPAFAAAVR